MINIEHLKKLSDQYDNETAIYSFVKKNHPAYQQLLSYGKDIIPFLMENIQKYNWMALALIHDLVDKKDLPVIDNETQAGKLKVLILMFQEWAKQNGYVK